MLFSKSVLLSRNGTFFLKKYLYQEGNKHLSSIAPIAILKAFIAPNIELFPRKVLFSKGVLLPRNGTFFLKKYLFQEGNKHLSSIAPIAILQSFIASNIELFPTKVLFSKGVLLSWNGTFFSKKVLISRR